MIKKVNRSKSEMYSEAGKASFERHYLIQIAGSILSPSNQKMHISLVPNLELSHDPFQRKIDFENFIKKQEGNKIKNDKKIKLEDQSKLNQPFSRYVSRDKLKEYGLNHIDLYEKIYFPNYKQIDRKSPSSINYQIQTKQQNVKNSFSSSKDLCSKLEASYNLFSNSNNNSKIKGSVYFSKQIGRQEQSQIKQSLQNTLEYSVLVNDISQSSKITEKAQKTKIELKNITQSYSVLDMSKNLGRNDIPAKWISQGQLCSAQYDPNYNQVLKRQDFSGPSFSKIVGRQQNNIGYPPQYSNKYNNISMIDIQEQFPQKQNKKVVVPQFNKKQSLHQNKNSLLPSFMKVYNSRMDLELPYSKINTDEIKNRNLKLFDTKNIARVEKFLKELEI